MEAENPFYEAATLHMVAQINYLEELIGRSLTPAERDNLHEFYLGLPLNIQSEFEVKMGYLL